MTLLEAKKITKTYADTGQPVEVLRGVDLAVSPGQLIGIYGASGSGKSTFLHILGGLDSPTGGQVLSDGKDISHFSSDELAKYRNRSIGFVFQFYHLLPEFSALENAMLPALIAGDGKREATEKASLALESVGLSDRLKNRPSELSGGEQQRVAIARASVCRPRLILADEPTGNLDRGMGDVVWRLLLDLNRAHDISMIIVTHNMELLNEIPIVYELADGILQQRTGDIHR